MGRGKQAEQGEVHQTRARHVWWRCESVAGRMWELIKAGGLIQGAALQPDQAGLQQVPLKRCVEQCRTLPD